jgi:putative nucleotidyltransferase with HDIG domain
MKYDKDTMKRTGKIIYIGQVSVYFGLLILALRHYLLSPADHFYMVALIMIIGFLPSLLLRFFLVRFISYILVSNALVLVSFIFTLLKEWPLGGVFILVPVYALLFKDRHIYLFASLASFVLNIVLAVTFLFDSKQSMHQIVTMLDLLTIFLILVFLIYFIVKDLVWKTVMETKHMQTIAALTKSVEAKDTYTKGHSDRVAYLGELIAQSVPKIDSKMVYYSGLIHDVGKLSIPDAILMKDSKLTEEEFDIIKTHTTLGAKICASLSIPEEIVLGVLHHHERWDGRGYPSALAGDRIPLIGRILCLADAIDAMSSNRAYRVALDIAWIRDEIARSSGSQFDPDIVQIALKHWDKIAASIQNKLK